MMDYAHTSSQKRSHMQSRFKRLSELFSSPITEVYLLFYQSVLPVLNLLLQREDPYNTFST